MANKTIIANRALSKLGQPRVSNIETTDTRPARSINGMYDSVLNALLAAYPWNFAIRRAILAPDATAPVWGWTYAYSLPSDYKSLYRIRYNPDYELENNKILTDEGTALYIQYISSATTPASYSAGFVETLACRLAFEACEEITQSNKKKDALAREYEKQLYEALMTDGAEEPSQIHQTDQWLIDRL